LKIPGSVVFDNSSFLSFNSLSNILDARLKLDITSIPLGLSMNLFKLLALPKLSQIDLN
jgi:hypothetical protein